MSLSVKIDMNMIIKNQICQIWKIIAVKNQQHNAVWSFFFAASWVTRSAMLKKGLQYFYQQYCE